MSDSNLACILYKKGDIRLVCCNCISYYNIAHFVHPPFMLALAGAQPQSTGIVLEG